MTLIRTPEQARLAASLQSRNGPDFAVGMCKKQTRLLYGVPSDGSDSAAVAWARTRHRLYGPADTWPRGVLIWWTGGSDDNGHVAMSDGGGYCWSVDILRPGRWDRVPIGKIATSWPRLHLVGASADIDGVVVVKVAAPKGSRITAARRRYHHDRIIDLRLLDAAVANGRTGAVKRARDELDRIMSQLLAEVPR